MCPGFDDALRSRRSWSSKSWEPPNPSPSGHGDLEEDQEQDNIQRGGMEVEAEELEGDLDHLGGDAAADDDDDDDELDDVLGRCSRRHSSSYFYDRQLYLHSYQFRRKLSVCDRLRGGIKRIKASAWSLVSCKYGNRRHHYQYSARKFCRRLSGAMASISLKPRCVQVPD